MADVNSLVALGMPANVAAAVVANDGADVLLALGVPIGLADVIVADGSVERLMAMGMPADLAVDVNAVIIA